MRILRGLASFRSLPMHKRTEHGTAVVADSLEQRVFLSAVVPTAVGAPAAPDYVVRIAYAVPSDRSPQPGGVAAIEDRFRLFQDWYRDQMDRNGFGLKTFTLETQADGVTPLVHVVNLPENAAYYRDDPTGPDDPNETWGRVIGGLQNAGYPINADKQIWLAFYDGAQQKPDGSYTGGFFGGTSANNGTAPASVGGFALLDNIALANLHPERLTDTRTYDGVIDPLIGPYPLKYGRTFAEFEGPTFATVASAHTGGVLHELSHGLALPHDFRNDGLRGNLMGNGLRGFGGTQFPQIFPGRETHLEYGSALVLSTSPYFNSGRPQTDLTPPTATLGLGPRPAPVNGLLQVPFTASDPGGLAAARLLRNGEAIDEMRLSGTSASGTFRTPYYDHERSDEYQLVVFDAFGNRAVRTTTSGPTAPANWAPVPNMQVNPERIVAGQPVVLDAIGTNDRDHAFSTLKFEWDLNDDGVFDTAPSNGSQLSTTFNAVGTRRIRLRVTDPAGASAVSAPIGIRVDQPTFSGTPFQVTRAGATTIQAEHFDLGGEGVAYHETTTANIGGAFRTGEAVDIKTTNDSGGGYRLSDTTVGEWVEYTIDVATAGLYKLEFRVGAPDPGGRFHAELSDVPGVTTGTLSVPDTNSWDVLRTVSRSGVSLPAGRHVLRVTFDALATGKTAAGGFNWIRISPESTTPPPPNPTPTDTVFQAESATRSGAVVASNQSGYTGSGFVDFTANSAQYLQFDVSVPSAGTYSLDFRYALGASSSRAMQLAVNGSVVSSAFSFPPTGAWTTWRVATAQASLNAGANTVRLTATGQSGPNIDALTVAPASTPTPTPTPSTSRITNSIGAFVRSGLSANRNFGSSSSLQVRRSSTDSSRESYLKFSLGSVSTISSAKLRVYGKLSASLSSGLGVSVLSSTNTSWSEGSITWNNRPATTGIVHGSTTVTGTSGKWYEIDLTTLLRDQKLAGNSTVTLVLRGTTNTSPYAIFNSDDASSNRPELLIVA